MYKQGSASQSAWSLRTVATAHYIVFRLQVSRVGNPGVSNIHKNAVLWQTINRKALLHMVKGNDTRALSQVLVRPVRHKQREGRCEKETLCKPLPAALITNTAKEIPKQSNALALEHAAYD